MSALGMRRIGTGIGLAGLLLLGATAVPAATLDIDDNGAVEAQTDGQLVLRYLMAGTGPELPEDTLSPTAPRDAADIFDRIDDLSTPPAEAPARVELVQVNSLTQDSIQLDWLRTFHSDTPSRSIINPMNAAQTDNSIPDAPTVGAEVVDDATGSIQPLTPSTNSSVTADAGGQRPQRPEALYQDAATYGDHHQAIAAA